MCLILQSKILKIHFRVIMLLVYNYVLLKMSTWYSKHVEESNNIWRINNIQCITLVVSDGCYTTFVPNKHWLCFASLKETEYFLGVTLDMRWDAAVCAEMIERASTLRWHLIGIEIFVREIGASRRGFKIVKVNTVEDIMQGENKWGQR